MVFSMIPIAVFQFLCHNSERLGQRAFKMSFGALYVNLGTHKRSAYMFNVLFLGRRLIYAISLAGFFTQTSVLNVLLQIVLSMALILYVIVVMPFEIRRDNWIEIMNECFILVTFYFTLGIIVNDYRMSGDMRSNLGLAMISVVLICIMANFLIFLISITS